MAKDSDAKREKREAKESKKVKVAQEDVLQDLFQDLYHDRRMIYKVNFWRGIFFGLGTFLGGTVVIALVVWVTSLFVNVPHIGEFFQDILKLLQYGQE